MKKISWRDLDVEESERTLKAAERKASEMAEKVACLQFDLQTVNEGKIQALNNEKLAAANLQNLFEEKNNTKK